MTHVVDPEKRAARFIALEVHESTHDRLVWGMRQNRDKSVSGVPEWEELRALASQIKEHTLTHLDHYLEEFEANATKLGTHVHWARDADEHNAVVYDVLNAHRVKSLIKSKSMLQEECGMTPYLQKRGIEVTESDLGERIQQLSDEPPSHICVYGKNHSSGQQINDSANVMKNYTHDASSDRLKVFWSYLCHRYRGVPYEVFSRVLDNSFIWNKMNVDKLWQIRVSN